MRALFLSLILLAAAPALAQSPQSVPLGGKSPDRDTTTEPRTPQGAPTATGSTQVDPNARNRPNGNVSPPASIGTGVQVIAPERK